MKVKLLESGGFAGLALGFNVDSDELEPAEAAELGELVAASGIESSDSRLSESARDLKQYDLTIKDGDREVSVTFDDRTMPASVKPLIGYLKKRSGPGG